MTNQFGIISQSPPVETPSGIHLYFRTMDGCFGFVFEKAANVLVHTCFILISSCNGVSTREKKFWSNQAWVENMFTSILVMRLLPAAPDMDITIFRMDIQYSKILWIEICTTVSAFGTKIQNCSQNLNHFHQWQDTSLLMCQKSWLVSQSH